MDTYKIRFERSIEVLQAPTMLSAIKKSCAAKHEPILSIEQTTRDGKPVHKTSFFNGSRGEQTWSNIAV